MNARVPVFASIPGPDLQSLVIVLTASAAAAFLSRIDRRIVLPTVILELVLGIALGPQVLGWADADAYIVGYITPPLCRFCDVL